MARQLFLIGMEDDAILTFYFLFWLVIMEIRRVKEYYMEIKKVAIAGTLESLMCRILIYQLETI